MAIELHVNCADEPGAGAAGGLGFGLRCFASAQLEPGFALFARYAALADRLQEAQLVLTGEGAIDHSTVMGKGVGELARLCQQKSVPCVGLGGVVGDPEPVKQLFAKTYALAPDLTNAQEAMKQPARWLEKAAATAASEWPVNNI